MKYLKSEVEESLQSLRDLLIPGETVYTNLRSCSSSGMSRSIDFYVLRDNSPRRITFDLCRVLGLSRHKRTEAAVLGGCGMDMGFHGVYGLSRTVFSEGFKCIGKGCPANDHNNEHFSGQPKIEKGGTHSDPGYALRHRWL